MNIGLIGSQNSHAGSYGKAFNIDRRYPGMTITHLWGESPESARERAAETQIATIVADSQEMVGQVDAIIIDTRDGANHLDHAEPFLAPGFPIFIDKPLATDIDQAAAFLAKASTIGARVDSHSIIPLQRSFIDFMAAARALAPLTHLTFAMPAAIDSEYSGMFFYTVHGVECLCRFLQRLPQRVRVERFTSGALATFDYADGPLVTMNLQGDNYSYHLMAVGEKDSLVRKLAYDEDVFQPGIDAIVALFTGAHQTPDADTLLMPVRILAALETSKQRDGEWVAVR
ncbi:MAG: Gfo/Idh/MocA family oxidoreductase [Armatimonadota bacterium]